MTDIIIHASEVSKWFDCAKRADHDHVNDVNHKKTDYAHVGVEHGSLVHAKITGADYTSNERIAFDIVTRTHSELDIHANHSAKKIKNWMSENKVNILSAEERLESSHYFNFADDVEMSKVNLIGTYDMICEIADSGTFLIDLKNGKRYPDKAFTQLSIYAHLIKYFSDKESPDYAAIIWQKRGDLTAEPSFIVRKFDELADVGKNYMNVLVNSIFTHDVTASPSLINCSTCALKKTCSVSASTEASINLRSLKWRIKQ